MEAALAGTNALDVSQVLTGLAGIFSEREKGQPLPLKLLHLLEAHSCALLPTFSPMVRPRGCRAVALTTPAAEMRSVSSAACPLQRRAAQCPAPISWHKPCDSCAPGMR